MVFGFDDFADVGILGVAWLIFSSLFPEVAPTIVEGAADFDAVFAAESAPITIGEPLTMTTQITQGSSIALIQDLLGEEGLETAVDIATGDYINYENLPVGQKELDMAEKVVETLKTTYSLEIQPTYNQALLNSIGKIIQSVSKKVPTTGQGFLNLITDIVKPLIDNPGETIGKATAIAGTVGGISTFGYSALQQIKGAFDRDENLPDNIQKMILNNNKPKNVQQEKPEEDTSDLLSAPDQVISNLPLPLF